MQKWRKVYRSAEAWQMFNRQSLKDLLYRRGINQKTFAEMTGIPANSISRYLSGSHNPNGTRITAMASALELTVEDITLSEDQQKAQKLKQPYCYCPFCGKKMPV